MLFDTLKISVDRIDNNSLKEKKITLSILRLDKIHPVVCGNKLFKLQYFLQEAIQNSSAGIITYGGAYSNHLVATAFACKTAGLKCVGIVRGEKPLTLSPTLMACMEYGMELIFISRADYTSIQAGDDANNFTNLWPNHLIVPEGGYHPKGAAGAALIMNFLPKNTTHICMAVGTATTLAGMAKAANKQQVIGIPVLKGMNDITERISYLTGSLQAFTLFDGYDFGGYAKKTIKLIAFMNQLYSLYNLPTDFVYTAKMMYAIFDKIENGYFAAESNIVCLHTGGLQGNQSLQKDILIF